MLNVLITNKKTGMYLLFKRQARCHFMLAVSRLDGYFPWADSARLQGPDEKGRELNLASTVLAVSCCFYNGAERRKF